MLAVRALRSRFLVVLLERMITEFARFSQRKVLREARMIAGTGMVLDDALGAYELTPQGRAFAVRNGLA
jgi:hypothetical protein